MKGSIRVTVTVMLAAALVAAGCSDDNNPMVPGSTTASVMFVHASPDAPAFDVKIDSTTLVLTAVAYPDTIGYRTLAAGTHRLQVDTTGTTNSAVDTTIVLVGGTRYSVFLADSAHKVSPLVLTDDLSAPLAGNAKIRFVHLSADAPAVDMRLVGQAALFSNRTFKQFAAFTNVPSDTTDIEVSQTGTSTVVATVPGAELQAGKIYTVVLRGFLLGLGDQAITASLIVHN